MQYRETVYLDDSQSRLSRKSVDKGRSVEGTGIMGVTTASAVSNSGVKHFADGINFYKLFWVFLIGSFAGFVAETTFALIRTGHLECRSNILFTPLNAIYGIGALVLYLCLNRLGNHIVLVFTVGTVAGTLVEYVCSWAQQTAFGSVSWDYSNFPLNINGRVCPLYSVFWGLLAIAWAKLIRPAMDKTIDSIPDQIGRPLTWVLAVLLLLAIVLTIVAFTRWGLRMEGFPPHYEFTCWVDAHFPDSLMQTVFATAQSAQ